MHPQPHDRDRGEHLLQAVANQIPVRPLKEAFSLVLGSDEGQAAGAAALER